MNKYRDTAERELKYSVPNRSLGNVKQLLSSLCLKDCQHDTRYVHSLYFDSENFEFAMEKAASDYLKRKIRIRFYSKSDNILHHSGSPCYLEVKDKLGSTREKKRKVLDGVDNQILSNGGMSFIDQLVEPELISLGYRFTQKIRPAFFISYKRDRYTDLFTGARIALDYQIAAQVVPEYSMGLVRSNYSLKQNVLEIKSTAKALPHNLRLLSNLDVKKYAFSKYYLCYQGLSGYEQ